MLAKRSLRRASFAVLTLIALTLAAVGLLALSVAFAPAGA